MTIGLIDGGKREKALQLLGLGSLFVGCAYIFVKGSCALNGKELKFRPANKSQEEISNNIPAKKGMLTRATEQSKN